MESEFLVGLNYELGVKIDEYERWKMLLDEFMLSRGPSSAATTAKHRWNSGQTPFGAHPVCTPTFSYGTRAKSASPPRRLRPDYPAAPSSRKRSAADAFFLDSIPPPLHHDYLSVPQPSQSYSQNRPLRPALVTQTSNSSLARSASLNRQLARLPSNFGGRRGSTGHVYPASTLKEPASQYQQPSPSTYGQLVQAAIQTEWDSSRALLAPYDDSLSQPQLVPPEVGFDNDNLLWRLTNHHYSTSCFIHLRLSHRQELQVTLVNPSCGIKLLSLGILLAIRLILHTRHIILKHLKPHTLTKLRLRNFLLRMSVCSTARSILQHRIIRLVMPVLTPRRKECTRLTPIQLHQAGPLCK